MMTSITNNIITDLKTRIPSATTLREYPQTTGDFPYIIVTEGDLSVDVSTMDSGGFHYNNYEITLEIFTDGAGKINQATKIRGQIDDLLGGEYGLERIYSSAIPNMGDLNVYRYRMTYVGKLDKNKTIFRR